MANTVIIKIFCEKVRDIGQKSAEGTTIRPWSDKTG